MEFATVKAIIENVEKVIIGKRLQIELAVTAMVAEYSGQFYTVNPV